MKAIDYEKQGLRSEDPTPEEEKYMLRLYVTGTTSKSIRALTNLKTFCEAYLAGRYVLEVVDIYQQPALAKEDQIIAAPTLIKELPLPLRRLIGDMGDTDKILLGLNLRKVTKDSDS